MELSLILAQKIIAMALMGAVGFGIVKCGLFRAEDSKVLSSLIVYVISPCTIFNAFQIEYTASKFQGLLLAALGAILVHIILIGGTKLLEKPLGLNRIEKASVVYSNAGNILIPLVQGVLGAKWVFYTSAYSTVQTALLWTHGVSVICKEDKINIRKIILNPNVIATIAGMLFFMSRLPLPGVLADCVGGFAAMIGPGSMLVIGMLMGAVDLKWLFRQKRPYLVCFMRLVLMPMISILIFRFTGLIGMHPEGETIFLIVLMATMAPVAAMVTQLAQVYEKDAVYASALNVMSVMFCIVTMPLMILFYEFII